MAPRIALASRALSPPGERAQRCAHEFEWVRGPPPHPSFSADTSRRPLPEGRGHYYDDRARGLSAQGGPLAYLHLTMSNSTRFFFPAARFCARVLSSLFAPDPETKGRAERREARTGLLVTLARRDSRVSGTRRIPLRPGRRPSALHRGDFRPRNPCCHLRQCRRIRSAPCPRPGHAAWRTGSRTSRTAVRAAAAGRHTPLRLQDRL